MKDTCALNKPVSHCFEILGCGVSPQNRLTEDEMPDSSDWQSAFQLWFYSQKLASQQIQQNTLLSKMCATPPFFLSCAHLFSMCPVVWKRPDRWRYPSISFHSVSFVRVLFFHWSIAQLAVYRSVYFPLARPLHMWDTDWSAANGWQSGGQIFFVLFIIFNSFVDHSRVHVHVCKSIIID